MSSTTPDESRLLLENIVADYNVADDTISISSFDPDLDRTPFFLTLHEKTPAEKAIRNLMMDKGVIKRDFNEFPPLVPRPISLDFKDPYAFGLGLGYNGVVNWQPMFDSNLIIAGCHGCGKSTMIDSIKTQAISNGNKWDLIVFDSDRFPDTKEYIRRTQDLIDLIEDRDNALEEERANIGEQAYDYQLSKEPTMRAVLITFDDVPTDEDENIEAGILDTIKYIMAVGDSVGIYVAMTTPYPEADTFTDQKFMSNFQAKAIMASRDTRVASQNILGAEKNLSQLQGLGRGGLTDSQGENVFQAYGPPLF